MPVTPPEKQAEEILREALQKIDALGYRAYLRDTEWRPRKGYEIDLRMINIEPK